MSPGAAIELTPSRIYWLHDHLVHAVDPDGPLVAGLPSVAYPLIRPPASTLHYIDSRGQARLRQASYATFDRSEDPPTVDESLIDDVEVETACTARDQPLHDIQFLSDGRAYVRCAETVRPSPWLDEEGNEVVNAEDSHVLERFGTEDLAILNDPSVLFPEAPHHLLDVGAGTRQEVTGIAGLWAATSALPAGRFLVVTEGGPSIRTLYEVAGDGGVTERGEYLLPDGVTAIQPGGVLDSDGNYYVIVFVDTTRRIAKLSTVPDESTLVDSAYVVRSDGFLFRSP